MKKIIAGLLATVMFCSAFTPPAAQKNQINEAAVQIAIENYLRCRFSKNYNAFFLMVDEYSEYAPYKVSDDITVISIAPATFKVHITPSVDTIGSVFIPTRHIIKDGKFFYWYDPNYGLTEEMVKLLFQYGIADSIDLLDPSVTLDDYTDNYIHYPDKVKTKGVNYYCCRKNPTKYKRVITKMATGWYEPPKVKCK